jgi:GT2 family glycosyltransferase
MKPVLVGIPTYSGAADLLPACLDAIRQRSGTSVPYDLVVVDDSGRPEHGAMTASVAAQFGARCIVHSTNKGVAAAWNSLVRSGDAPSIALLNDDFFVSPGWLEALAYALDENPQAGSFGLFAYFIVMDDVWRLLAAPDATVMPRDPFTKAPAPTEAHHGKEQPGRVMAPTGCGFGFRRAMYDTVGGFDESLGKAFYEEADFGSSCARLGFPSYCLQWPMCWHLWSATMARSPEVMARRPMEAARARYIEKWGRHYDGPTGTHAEFMGRIPFQRIKWLDRDGPRDELITAEDGFFEAAE